MIFLFFFYELDKIDYKNLNQVKLKKSSMNMKRKKERFKIN